MGLKLGIGVITYNRRDMLRQGLEKIRLFTRTPHELVVGDDGSDDGTVALLSRLNIPYITGENRGIAWNRNRVLWWLKEEKKCDVIIILEDDCHPAIYGWEEEWIQAVIAYGHMNYMSEMTLKIDSDVIVGSGTARDPYIAPMHQAFCVGYLARALEFVGYLDVRFGKYGEEHAEHTNRFLRAGYGGIPQYLTPENSQVFYLSGGLTLLDSETHGSFDSVMENIELHHSLQNEPIYRTAWRDDLQMFIFREEMEAARNRPSFVKDSQDNGFDILISLGGDERTGKFIEEVFGEGENSLFNSFITPFKSLVFLFEEGFKDLYLADYIEPHHEVLRCRKTMLIYHRCLKLASGEKATIELYKQQLERLKREADLQIEKMDYLCNGKKRVLFIRDWRETLHYMGIHRPEHSYMPDFTRLVRALEKRYPSLDFKILFLNYGGAYVEHPRMIFANLSLPDICDELSCARAWRMMAGRLGLYLRGNDSWRD